MTANNVVGTLQLIAELGRIARARGILFHTDAVQAVGKIPLYVQRGSWSCAIDSSHDELLAAQATIGWPTYGRATGPTSCRRQRINYLKIYIMLATAVSGCVE